LTYASLIPVKLVINPPSFTRIQLEGGLRDEKSKRSIGLFYCCLIYVSVHCWRQ